MTRLEEAYEALVTAENAFARECVRVHGETAYRNCVRQHRDTPKLAKLRKALQNAAEAYSSAWVAIAKSTTSSDDTGTWDGIDTSRPGGGFLH